MCGICGVVKVRPPGYIDKRLLVQMRDSMVHRGPDDEGVFTGEAVGLGFRRLSIIDLTGGHQPMANDDESVWIVYNGELYNFRQLRMALESKGYIFRTKSDTEVILHAYEAFGDSFLERLRGMFALAIWDRRRRRLFLARDRLGIKPLYHTMHDGTFLFASEIKAILQWPGIPREVDPVSLREYLRLRYVPAPRTMFKQISKLQPGHALIVENGNVDIYRYWDLPLDGGEVSPESAEQSLRDRLEECVGGHLVSDVPLGVFLSGGIDSTVLTGLMAGIVPDAVQSFSVGYPEGNADGADERPFARIAAKRFHTAHRELALDQQGFWECLPGLVWHLDEPVADPASIPLYFLSKFSRQFVTVALSGEGADEILAGYGIYRKMLWLERLRGLRPLVPPPLLGGRKLRRYLQWMRLPLESRYRGVSTLFTEPEIDRLLLEPGSGHDPDFGTQFFDRTAGLDALKRMLYFDLKVWLPDDLLIKADKMTMAASVELRVPFLDHTLVEWAWRLPSNLKVRGRTGKFLLRRAAADLIPAEILNRPKQGFTIPLRTWFREGLGRHARRFLLEERVGHALFRERELEALIARHEHGREDLSGALFGVVLMAFWYQIFIEAHTVEAPACVGTPRHA